jgi:hypothetical protein
MDQQLATILPFNSRASALIGGLLEAEPEAIIDAARVHLRRSRHAMIVVPHIIDPRSTWEAGLVHVYCGRSDQSELCTLDPTSAWNLARELLTCARAAAAASMHEWNVPDDLGQDVIEAGALR